MTLFCITDIERLQCITIIEMQGDILCTVTNLHIKWRWWRLTEDQAKRTCLFILTLYTGTYPYTCSVKTNIIIIVYWLEIAVYSCVRTFHNVKINWQFKFYILGYQDTCVANLVQHHRQHVTMLQQLTTLSNHSTSNNFNHVFSSHISDKLNDCC